MRNLFVAIVLAASASLAAPAAQAQTVIHEWPIANMQTSVPASSLCTIRIERVYAAGGATTTYMYAQIRNTGTRALIAGGNASYTTNSGAGNRQGNFSGAALPPGAGTAVRTILLPPGAYMGSRATVNVTSCIQS